VAGNCGFRRSSRSNDNLDAAAFQSFCRPLTHPRTDHQFATVNGGENSGMAMGLVVRGTIMARALSVRMDHAVAL
jgi:hypothetical protein